MTFEIDINGRTRTVTIDRAGPDDRRLRVRVDGRSRLVDVRRLQGSTLSLLLLDERPASHEVGIAETGVPGELLVHLRDGVVRAIVNGRRTSRGAGAAGAPGGERRVTSPMPGKVVRVLVAPGAEVAARQPLVIVEAMKMENELFSPTPGRVREVAVREGESVEAGRLLVVVE